MPARGRDGGGEDDAPQRGEARLAAQELRPHLDRQRHRADRKAGRQHRLQRGQRKDAEPDGDHERQVEVGRADRQRAARPAGIAGDAEHVVGVEEEAERDRHQHRDFQRGVEARPVAGPQRQGRKQQRHRHAPHHHLAPIGPADGVGVDRDPGQRQQRKDAGDQPHPAGDEIGPLAHRRGGMIVRQEQVAGVAHRLPRAGRQQRQRAHPGHGRGALRFLMRVLLHRRRLSDPRMLPANVRWMLALFMCAEGARPNAAAGKHHKFHAVVKDRRGLTDSSP
jgi:hypothetical protein